MFVFLNKEYIVIILIVLVIHSIPVRFPRNFTIFLKELLTWFELDRRDDIIYFSYNDC